MSATYLEVKWSVSRGRETYGYNICTLTDTSTGKRFRWDGGGYDMLGAAFGEWLQETHGNALAAIYQDAYSFYTNGIRTDGTSPNRHYGMVVYMRPDGGVKHVSLDGACGLESMRAIAKAIGLSVKSTVNRKGNVTGFIVEA